MRLSWPCGNCVTSMVGARRVSAFASYGRTSRSGRGCRRPLALWCGTPASPRSRPIRKQQSRCGLTDARVAQSVGAVVVAGRAVDQLTEYVHVAGVPRSLFDHVDEHPPHRDLIAEPRIAELLNAHLADDHVGRTACTVVEVDDVGSRLVRCDAQIRFRIFLVERHRFGLSPEGGA